MFGAKAIVSQQWLEHTSFNKNRILKALVWVRLDGVAFSLWILKGLSDTIYCLCTASCKNFSH